MYELKTQIIIMDHIYKNLHAYYYCLDDIIIIENIFLYKEQNSVENMLIEIHKNIVNYDIILFDPNIIKYNEIVFNRIFAHSNYETKNTIYTSFYCITKSNNDVKKFVDILKNYFIAVKFTNLNSINGNITYIEYDRFGWHTYKLGNDFILNGLNMAYKSSTYFFKSNSYFISVRPYNSLYACKKEIFITNNLFNYTIGLQLTTENDRKLIFFNTETNLQCTI